MTKVIVTFEKNWRGYAAGETAGFDSAVAESLIESSYAVEAVKSISKKGKPATGAAPASGKPATGNDADADGAGSPSDQVDADGKP